jgi:hypothetical protein
MNYSLKTDSFVPAGNEHDADNIIGTQVINETNAKCNLLN